MADYLQHTLLTKFIGHKKVKQKTNAFFYQLNQLQEKSHSIII